MSEKSHIPSYKKNSTAHSTEFSLKSLSSEILFRYLFRGDSVKRIERDLFGAEEFSGWLAKTLLNFYGVDTSSEVKNRGIYKGLSPIAVVKYLQSSSDDSERIVGAILAEKIPVNF